jgi:hypothetical protein
MMIGYLILLALAVAFIFVGVKGFSAEGLAFSAKTRIKGMAGKVVGAVCVLIGLGILCMTIFDIMSQRG